MDDHGRLKRRLLILRMPVAGALLLPAGTALAQKTPAPPEPAPKAPPEPRRAPPPVTDSDPSDPPGRGRGRQRPQGPTDSDPHDPVGRGRGSGPRTYST